MSGRNGRLLAGFVVLHVLCCGLPLLIAAGAFTGAGALLGNGTLIAAGMLMVLAAVAVAVPRGRLWPRTPPAAPLRPADLHRQEWCSPVAAEQDRSVPFPHLGCARGRNGRVLSGPRRLGER